MRVSSVRLELAEQASMRNAVYRARHSAGFIAEKTWRLLRMPAKPNG